MLNYLMLTVQSMIGIIAAKIPHASWKVYNHVEFLSYLLGLSMVLWDL